MNLVSNSSWESSDPPNFWAKVAPTDHLLHIYEEKNELLDLLEGFVTAGIKKNDCILLIATEEHLNALRSRLLKKGFNVDALIADDQYLAFHVEEILSEFMIGGWPDETLFFEAVRKLTAKASAKHRSVRAFGEMVALLWSQGRSGATVQLEHLWNKFREQQNFCLFCAYPKTGFPQNPDEAVNNICCTHSMIIAPKKNSKKEEVLYKPINIKKPIN